MGNAAECAQYKQSVLTCIFALRAARGVRGVGTREMEHILVMEWVHIGLEGIGNTCGCGYRYGHHAIGVDVSVFVGNI